MTDSHDGRQPSRRDFVRAAAAGVLGAGALSLAACAPAPEMADTTDLRSAKDTSLNADTGQVAVQKPPALGKLALQLYTVRDAMAQDLAGTLRRVKALGYDHVETAFWPKGVTLDQAAGALRDAGLTVVSSHIELPQGDKRQLMLDTARAFGSTRMIWHGWPQDPRYSTMDGTKQLARLYNEANAIATDNGLTFGLHNHWWEYRNVMNNMFAYEVLLGELQPDIFFEVDTYWVKVAGLDPAAIVRRHGARAPLLHIKDGPARWHENLATDNPDPMTAVGQGAQDFPAIVRAAAGHTQFMVVEMDKVAGDVFDALATSRMYLLSHSLVQS